MNFSYGNYARNYDTIRPRMQLGPQAPRPMMTANQGMSPTGQLSQPPQMSAPLTASPMQGQPAIPPVQPNYGAIAQQMTPRTGMVGIPRLAGGPMGMR
jgi:hypothetical protein